MQNPEEKKAERILEFLQIFFMPHKSTLIHQIQDLDFMFEYFLNSVLFVLQNRQSNSIIRTGLNLVLSLTSQLPIKPSIMCFLSNLIEVCALQLLTNFFSRLSS